MTVDIAMEGVEESTPIMASTWAGLVQGALEAVDISSSPLAKARATFIPLGMEKHES